MTYNMCVLHMCRALVTNEGLEERNDVVVMSVSEDQPCGRVLLGLESVRQLRRQAVENGVCKFVAPS